LAVDGDVDIALGRVHRFDGAGVGVGQGDGGDQKGEQREDASAGGKAWADSWRSAPARPRREVRGRRPAGTGACGCRKISPGSSRGARKKSALPGRFAGAPPAGAVDWRATVTERLGRASRQSDAAGLFFVSTPSGSAVDCPAPVDIPATLGYEG